MEQQKGLAIKLELPRCIFYLIWNGCDNTKFQAEMEMESGRPNCRLSEKKVSERFAEEFSICPEVLPKKVTKTLLKCRRSSKLIWIHRFDATFALMKVSKVSESNWYLQDLLSDQYWPWSYPSPLTPALLRSMGIFVDSAAAAVGAFGPSGLTKRKKQQKERTKLTGRHLTCTSPLSRGNAWRQSDHRLLVCVPSLPLPPLLSFFSLSYLSAA